MPEKNLQKKFDTFSWQNNKSYFEAWKKGKTGYPIVDAGMRQLWETGYIHNRVRMIVGSFLVKNLLLHWHCGAKWFWDCLALLCHIVKSNAIQSTILNSKLLCSIMLYTEKLVRKICTDIL